MYSNGRFYHLFIPCFVVVVVVVGFKVLLRYHWHLWAHGLHRVHGVPWAHGPHGPHGPHGAHGLMGLDGPLGPLAGGVGPGPGDV